MPGERDKTFKWKTVEDLSFLYLYRTPVLVKSRDISDEYYVCKVGCSGECNIISRLHEQTNSYKNNTVLDIGFKHNLKTNDTTEWVEDVFAHAESYPNLGFILPGGTWEARVLERLNTVLCKEAKARIKDRDFDSRFLRTKKDQSAALTKKKFEKWLVRDVGDVQLSKTMITRVKHLRVGTTEWVLMPKKLFNDIQSGWKNKKIKTPLDVIDEITSEHPKRDRKRDRTCLWEYKLKEGDEYPIYVSYSEKTPLPRCDDEEHEKETE